VIRGQWASHRKLRRRTSYRGVSRGDSIGNAQESLNFEQLVSKWLTEYFACDAARPHRLQLA
jgi:hypothetical protein